MTNANTKTGRPRTEGKLNSLVGTVRKCKRCGGEFKTIYLHEVHYVFCLDCRLESAERATRSAGRDCLEYVTNGEGYRLTRGFNLMDRAYDNE